MNSINQPARSSSKKTDSAEDQSSSKNSTQLLTLSLFIVLLAFFIVLSASYGFDRDKVDNAMDSINAAFGAQIFSAASLQSSMQSSDEGGSGSGFATTQDFRAYMQDSFQGFDLRVSDIGEGKVAAQLKLDKDDFYRHFKFISRKMGSVYARSGTGQITFDLIDRASAPVNRAKILNLSKLALRTKEYGLPSGVMNVGFEIGEDDVFIISFIFES